MKIARVFPRKTNATPTDDLAFYGPPGLFVPEVDEVHISVTFTYDLDYARELQWQWGAVHDNVKLGGPATGQRGEQFEPGMYIKPGYVITSRGCPNNCWFCSVPKRDGNIRELEIKEGYNLLDDNLLACSDAHIKAVFAMLKKQPGRTFTGGLEALRLKEWHVKALKELKPVACFFAYDTPDDYEPLKKASELLLDYKFTNHQMKCYVLCGFPKDTMKEAEGRMWQCIDLGFYPKAMLWRNKQGHKDSIWGRFQRKWNLPAIIYSEIKKRKLA